MNMNIDEMVDTQDTDMTAVDAAQGPSKLTTGLIIGGISIGSIVLWELLVKPVVKPVANAIKSKVFGKAKVAGSGTDTPNDDEVVE